jgi:hypothetical protein
MTSHQNESPGAVRLMRKPRLWSIAYHSHMTSPLTCEELVDLALQAGGRNRTLGLTGILLFDRNCFFQILEGHRDFVTDAYAAIAADSRHSRLVKVVDEAIPHRAFAGWSMRLVTTADLSAENRAIVSEALRAAESLDGAQSESLKRACLELCTVALTQGASCGPTPRRSTGDNPVARIR